MPGRKQKKSPNIFGASLFSRAFRKFQNLHIAEQRIHLTQARFDAHPRIYFLVKMHLSRRLSGRRHAGLGLEAYATVTSPIRRYVDLLNRDR